MANGALARSGMISFHCHAADSPPALPFRPMYCRRLLEAYRDRMVAAMSDWLDGRDPCDANLAPSRGAFDSESFFVPGLPAVPADRARKAHDAALRRLVEVACDRFCFADLLSAGLELLSGAEGSFGLVLSHSLDCAQDLVVAARGQTMSLAFYPSKGLVVFGSESAATKVGMGGDGEGASFRFDLNDVNGEVALLRWGATSEGGGLDAEVSSAPGQRKSICCAGAERDATVVFTYPGPPQAPSRALLCVNLVPGEASPSPAQSNIWRRRLRLDGNPLLSPLPAALQSTDPVGADLLDMPRVVEQLTEDFDGKAHSPNRITAWTFTSKLRQRLRAHRAGKHDGSVDLLITGCEVSLWVGEQFAADLTRVYPKMKIVTLSANKLLGQLGQRLPIPQPGFPFHEGTHDFRNTIVLVLTHSGGTYAPLLCCSLFKGFTSNIFVVTSELDTQAARAVRSGAPRPSRSQKDTAVYTAAPSPTVAPSSTSHASSCRTDGVGSGGFLELDSQFVFSTHAGLRPAEPCSVSVVAMHHLLTHLLIFMMGYLSHFEHGPRPHGGASASICGSSYEFEEVRELAALSRLQADALRGIVGHRSIGDTPASAQLCAKGRWWAQHVLEGPRSWLLSVAYIAATVFVGTTPLHAVATAVVGSSLPSPLSTSSAAVGVNTSFVEDGAVGGASPAVPAWLWAVRYTVCFLDVTIYSFLGWWTAVVLRLLQGRPWLHRVAGRSVLIGDVPWVAQSVEAFASKLFALSYSIASCSFASANPSDHLVHRHTHRVVRGSLLAVGRPDGRTNSLTTAEAACALSVSQASSIQNLGVTCESVTIGHNPFKLPLAADHLVLPTLRPPFLCEVLRSLEGDATPASSRHSSRAPTPQGSMHGTKSAQGSQHGGRLAHETLHLAAQRLAARSREPSVSGGGQFFEGAGVGSSQHGQSASSSGEQFPGRDSREFSRGRGAKEGYFSERMLFEHLASGGGLSSPDRSVHGRSFHGGMRGLAAAAGLGTAGTLTSKEPSTSGSQQFLGVFETTVGTRPSRTPSNEAMSPTSRSHEGSRNRDAIKYFASCGGGLMDASKPLVSLAEGESDTGGGVAPPSARHAPSSPKSSSSPPPRPSPPPSPPTTLGAEQVLSTRRGIGGHRTKALLHPGSTSDHRCCAASNGGVADSPNAMKATLARLGQRSRRLFDRAAGPINSLSLAAFKQARFAIEPLTEPFLGAWMSGQVGYVTLGNDELMRRQQLVQVLSESRFDELQRLVSFFVLFHSMGKAVQDWWPRWSLGLLGYDMARSQSIMRVATTASPVSGMEVRERMLAIQTETRKAQAASSFQRTWRAVRLQRWMRNVRAPTDTKARSN